MFSKNSRYQKVPDAVTTDSKGKAFKSKTIRSLPKAPGTFSHTIESLDRLDHLAYKYYKQPRKWWRICDANPEFVSPQDLLGKGPMVKVRFPLVFDDKDTQPQWTELLKKLSEVVGVEDVRFEERVELVEKEQMEGGEKVIVYKERFENAVVITYNEINVNVEELSQEITSLEFKVGEPENIGRVGKRIIIPPDVVG